MAPPPFPHPPVLPRGLRPLARSSLDPRERLLEVRSRGLPGDLADPAGTGGDSEPFSPGRPPGPRSSSRMGPPPYSPLPPYRPRPSHRGRGRTCGRAVRRLGKAAGEHLPASAPRPSSSSHSSTNPDEKGSVKPLGAVQIFWSGVEGSGGQGGAVVGVVVVERGGRAAKRGLGRAAALALSLLVLLGRDGSDRAGDAGASATPFSFYCVSSPFTTPLSLVQWRVKRRSRGKRA